VSDDDVLELLGRPTRYATAAVRDISDRIELALSRADGHSGDRERTIQIPIAGGAIVGDLGMPRRKLYASDVRTSGSVRGLAIIAHGDRGNRNGYGSRYIAGRLRLSGYATLRLDLLTGQEQRMDADGASHGLDVERLAARLATACDWVAREGVAGAHQTTLIGAGTAAAVALMTAARRQQSIRAVVARGARVDLAAHALANVRASVLLVVGATDQMTLRRNGDALLQLPRDAALLKVPRVGPAFDEPGALGFVAERAVSWLDMLDRRERTWRGPFGARGA
jgi:dienelactone hydrolase